MTQPQALKILKSSKNIFLTGSAGAGKTFLLNKFINHLKKKKVKHGVTASTGIAATHLGGRTIHSWCGMGIESELKDSEIKKLFRKEELKERIRRAQVLIIDEISMLDSERLDLLDKICKAVKNPFLAFGGIQIIMCGDFFQLPPVDRERRGIKFAYDAGAWKQADAAVCYLDEQYRQDDIEFVEILNSIRSNEAGEEVLSQLKTRLYQKIKHQIKPTKLYTHNADVDAINSFELSKIPKKEKIYQMTSHGPQELVNSLKKGCMAPEELKLKLGAMVMFVKNNFDAGYVNGTLGQVIDFDDDDYPVIKTRYEEEIIATPASWNIEEDEEIIASVRQIPLRLAWAITVHKSQGMSLDVAEIDLSKSFERGMGYVALSRVRRLDGIRLMGINQMALCVSQQIIEKDKEFRELSKQTENNFLAPNSSQTQKKPR